MKAKRITSLTKAKRTDDEKEEERKAKAVREAANRDADNESPNPREAALNRKRNTLNDQNANSNQQETYRQSV
ncbi:MAG TPA: hypothetical protein VJ772_09890 [Nitrososphaeraceae archaeon]|nr:hypothetical protein [Nitrososphaeraceae archaeon]